MGCCQCETKFKEVYKYGTFYIKRYDPRGSYTVEPDTRYCDWEWVYDCNPPENEYYIDTLVKIYRNIEGAAISKCNCTNASGGTPDQQDEIPTTSNAEEKGLIIKRFCGHWKPISGPCYPGLTCSSYHNIQYMKILQINNSEANYTNKHWCGKECPGAPYPANRKIDKVAEFRMKVTNYQG
jgi:hypothetical protein